MNEIVEDAHRLGFFDEPPEAAIDATGLSADGRSSYYAQRLRRSHRSTDGRGQKPKKTKRYKHIKWPKINAIVHTQSHLIVAASFNEGPSHDSPEFAALLRQAAARVYWDRVLADSGYDAEEHHRLARQDLQIPKTLIALNPRNQGRKWPKTKYRRQMKTNFHRRIFGQRWQIESVWSRWKRRLGWVLACHSPARQMHECQNRVLTYNLMLLACH